MRRTARRGCGAKGVRREGGAALRRSGLHQVARERAADRDAGTPEATRGRPPARAAPGENQVRYWQVSRRRNSPCPARPSQVPSSRMTVPRESTVRALPVSCLPSYAE